MGDYVVDVDAALALGRAHAEAAVELAGLGLRQLSVADDAPFLAAAAFLGVDSARQVVDSVRSLVGDSLCSVEDLSRLEVLIARRVAVIAGEEVVALGENAALTAAARLATAAEAATGLARDLWTYDPPATVPGGWRGPDGKPLSSPPVRKTELAVEGAGYVPFRAVSVTGGLELTWTIEELGHGRYRLRVHITALAGGAEGLAARGQDVDAALSLGGDGDLYWDLTSRDDARVLAERVGFELATALGGAPGQLASRLAYGLKGKDWRIPPPTGGTAGLVLRGEAGADAEHLGAVKGVLQKALGALGVSVTIKDASGAVAAKGEGGPYVAFGPADDPGKGMSVTGYQRLHGEVSASLDVQTATALALPAALQDYDGTVTVSADVKLDPFSRHTSVEFKLTGDLTVTDALKADLPHAASAELGAGSKASLEGSFTVDAGWLDPRELARRADDPRALMAYVRDHVDPSWQVSLYAGSVADASVDASDLGGSKLGKAGVEGSVTLSDQRLVRSWP
jgi:hypothetical protein